MVCCLSRNPWKKRYRGKQEKASKKTKPETGYVSGFNIYFWLRIEGSDFILIIGISSHFCDVFCQSYYLMGIAIFVVIPDINNN